ncbi:polyphenol oxidase family protein [Synergistaceae bacterium OttesenSCG-928-I11]|nr:polyphenol oxidase family protein [Synergistaceae bacterium OttesenSCG-928-I11]
MDSTEGDPLRIARAIRPLLGEHSLIAPYQVHGTAIAEARRIWALPQRVMADGVHLDPSFDPASVVTASLRFADCSPIVLTSYEPHPWAIALHSGFQGTTKNIFASAWARAKNFYGSLLPASVSVWLGPAIGPCCYTRRKDDPTTLRACKTWHPANFEKGETFVRFDLHAEIAAQIHGVGIPTENVFRFPLCTCCNTDHLYSYRGGDEKNRMLLLVKLRDF